MSRLVSYISSQFGNPRGSAGAIVSRIQNIFNRAMYRKTVSLVRLQRNEKLLDIGYGNGHLLKMIDRQSDADLYGIDISPDAMAMAEKKNRRAKAAGRLHLCVGDCCALPYGDNTFSAVTSVNTVYFWQDTLKGLTEIRRTLLPGKSFYNVVISRAALDTIPFTRVGYRKFDTEELIRLGLQAGFTHVEEREIMKGRSSVIICTK